MGKDARDKETDRVPVSDISKIRLHDRVMALVELPTNPTYRTFAEARVFARGLGLGNKAAWGVWAKSSKRPKDIPATPSQVYRSEFISWANWLGKEGRTVEDHLQTARTLARKYKGVLPRRIWLVKNGYSRLASCMTKHPERFKDIRQDSGAGTAFPEHVLVAEQLAKKNGGVLQNVKWLVSHGYSRLNYHMKRHPEAFAHIPQVRQRVSPQTLLDTAVRLAKGNKGVMPTQIWCKKNGFAGVHHVINRHPELFLAKFRRTGGYHAVYILKGI